MMKTILVLFALCCASSLSAQEQRVVSDDLRSLRVVVDGDPLLPPVVELGRGARLAVEFDEMSHEYHRYTYHIDLCNADWTVSDELFESDFLSGLNDQPLEDYEKSFNTTQLYTHYRLVLPSQQTRLKVAGNYRVSILDEDGETAATAEFCVVKPLVNIIAQATGNTDVDFNAAHQQLDLSLSYGRLVVGDAERELHVVVVQNRRPDRRVVDPKPTYRKGAALEYTHHRDLIFEAGNEFHKFELLDVNKPGMGVDHVRWLDPYYYVSLFEDAPARSYVYDEDQNGASFIRREDDEDNATLPEYAWFNFSFRSPRLESDVYVCGTWTNGVLDPAALMRYDEAGGTYTASLYLKQGYYNYQYRTGEGLCLDGNFFETDNEYMVFVYHRAPTARYDELVGYRVFRTSTTQD